MQFIRKNNYLILAAILCLLFTSLGINTMKNEIIYEKVTVAEGDTLWGYAILYAKQTPKEKWIKETVQLNDLPSTTIRIGEELRLPGGKSVKPNKLSTQIAGVEQ